MSFPIDPPIEPMLAQLVDGFPSQDGLLFEPKWDGFRALVFRSGDEVYIQSREKRPLDRYFPELVTAFRAALPPRAVIDGEIVVPRPGGLDFEALQLRLHPAASRVAKLAAEIPASFVAFDLLALDDEDFRMRPTRERRARLEAALLAALPPVYLTPATTDVALAQEWFRRFEGAGLDGVIAKPLELGYQPKRRVMFKIKHRHTVDCAVAGFRWHKNGEGTLVGSLLLGLFDDAGLHHVGVTASFTAKQRAALAQELEPLRAGALEAHPWRAWAGLGDETRRPGMESRWSRGKDLGWEPLRVERVAEVSYDHLQGRRFRHGATFVRWRPDRRPDSCRYDQLDTTPPDELFSLFGRA